MYLACVAGARKGKGEGKIGRREAPATQATVYLISLEDSTD